MIKILRKLWRSFRSLFERGDSVQVLPPLTAPRQKPNPLRPNERRINEVRRALDQAPDGLSHRAIIAWVREQTGRCASPKLIVRLMREKTGPCVLVAAALLMSCATHPQQTATIATPIPMPQPVVMTDAPKPSDKPRLIKVKLTISTPDDLRVKVGQTVDAGAILSDRKAERDRLLTQRRLLAASSQRIRLQIAAAAESIRLIEEMGAQLPPSSFATERAAIRGAEVDVSSTVRKTAIHRERVKVIPAVAGSAGIDRDLVESHESARLQLVEDSAAQASADVELAKARLQAAQESRIYDEQKHRFEFARQLLTARNGQQRHLMIRCKQPFAM